MKSWSVTIQMKATKQYFPSVMMYQEDPPNLWVSGQNAMNDML